MTYGELVRLCLLEDAQETLPPMDFLWKILGQIRGAGEEKARDGPGSQENTNL